MKKSKLIVGLMLALAVVALPMAVMSTTKAEDKKTIVLTKSNTVVLNDEVNGETVGKVIAEAKALDSQSSMFGFGKKEPIHLFLYTPGGSIQSGLELIEALQGLDRPVDTVTVFAASMGFQIAQNLGDRNIVGSGVLMSHRAYGGFEGEFGGKNPSQMLSRMRIWEQRLTEMDKQTVARTKGKQTLESYQEAYSTELWVTGQEAIDQGYADRIVNVRCDSSLSGVTTHQVEFMGMTVLYDLDNCPLNSAPMNIRVQLPTTGGPEESDSFIQKGGGFGSACLMEASTAPTKKCAIDTTVTPEKIKEVKSLFKSNRSPEKRIGRKAAEGLYW